MFITVDELRGLTSFSEVSALDDLKLQHYMDRADSWIRRATGSPLLNASQSIEIQQDMKIATLLLVEYLWYWDDPETKESALSQDDSVRIGSFSYNKAEPGEKTGIQELDNILEHHKWQPDLNNFFRISGPSRK